MIAYAVYQALPTQKEEPSLRRIGGPFLVASAANILWLFFWHYNRLALTEFAMLTLLASLIVIYLRLGIGVRLVSTGMRWAVHVPFSVYLGWISVATIANTTDLLYYLNWDGWGIAPQTWAVIMLAVATLLGLLMALRRRDIAFLAVLLWAFVGIAVKQAEFPQVATAAWLASVAVVLEIVLAGWVIRKQMRLQPA